MTKTEIKKLVASIPTNELADVLKQLDEIEAGKFKVINGIGYAVSVNVGGAR